MGCVGLESHWRQLLVYTTVKLAEHSPPTHHVAGTAEDFSQAAHDDICIRQDIDIQEITNRLIDYDREAILVG
jgi:hypothetical protein